jgi:hypothetical protein
MSAKVVKKGKSKMFWIIGGVLLVAGGIGAYFLLRKPKEDKDGDTDDDTDVDTKKDVNIGSNVSASFTAPKELNSEVKIKAFQDWMDSQGKGWIQKDGKWVLLNKGEGYGNYGKNTDAVWKVYGDDYLKWLSQSRPSSSPSSSSSTPTKIDTIINFATGKKAEKSYLQKANSNFVNDWAGAIKSNKTAFIWENQVYRTKTGEKLLEYNPINTIHYSTIAGSIAKLEPKANAGATYIKKGLNVGKVKAIEYNNGLWFYLPDNGGDYKWGMAKYFSRKKPFFSFDGSSEQLEFSSFDNNLDLNL